MPYIRHRVNTHELELVESVIRLYPLPCFHIGAPQSDVQFIREHIRRIEQDPAARWVYMGDGGECVVKGSKGDVYSQLYSPQEQIDLLVELFRPVRDKGLFAIRGNHGNRIYKETGLSFDKSFATALGVPYMGVCTHGNLTVNRSSYDFYFHHGIDSGVALTSKVSKAEAFRPFIDVDAIFTAHSHIAMDLPPAALLSCDNVNCKVRTKMRHQYICGSGYDSRVGYATDRGYPPLLPSFVVVEFDGRIVQGYPQHMQTTTVYRSDGQHEVNGDYGLVRDVTYTQ